MKFIIHYKETKKYSVEVEAESREDVLRIWEESKEELHEQAQLNSHHTFKYPFAALETKQ